MSHFLETALFFLIFNLERSSFHQINQKDVSKKRKYLTRHMTHFWQPRFLYDARATRYERYIPKTALSSLVFDLERSSFHQINQKDVSKRQKYSTRNMTHIWSTRILHDARATRYETHILKRAISSSIFD